MGDGDKVIQLFTPLRETWLYRVNPALKFAVVVLLLLGALINRQYDFALNQVIVYTILLLLFSGFGLKKTLLFLAPFLFIFISSASSMILFGQGEHVWWSWGIFKISEESVFHGTLLGLKTISFGLLGLMFALTSRPVLFFYALMQQFKLPPKYGYSFIASFRLLPMIVEEVRTRKDALNVRGVKYAKGVKGWYERLSQYAVPLTAQSIRRALRVAVAMESKRFHIQASRTYYYRTSYSRIDIIFAAMFVVLMAAIYAVAVYSPLIGWSIP
jgi:energy-coupling factor transport system permease protein